MERALTLHFVDGTKLSFDFDEQAANVHARKIKLDDFLAGQHLVVEAEGSVLIFPVASIKYMAFATPFVDTKAITAALPRHAIVRARLRE